MPCSAAKPKRSARGAFNPIDPLLGLLTFLSVISACAGCAGRHPPESAAARDAPGAEGGRRVAFSGVLRVTERGDSKRFRVRIYAQEPDRFRVEGSGALGGVAVIVTGMEGRACIVVPSRRTYAEGTLTEDLGTPLIGRSLIGCDLLRAIFLAGTLHEPAECSHTDPVESISEENGDVVRSIRIGALSYVVVTDGRARATTAREVRLEDRAQPGVSMNLVGLRPLAWPVAVPEGLFREPLPAGSKRVGLEVIGAQTAP